MDDRPFSVDRMSLEKIFDIKYINDPPIREKEKEKKMV